MLVHFLRFELRGKGWKARLVAFRFSVTSVLRPLRTLCEAFPLSLLTAESMSSFRAERPGFFLRAVLARRVAEGEISLFSRS